MAPSFVQFFKIEIRKNLHHFFPSEIVMRNSFFRTFQRYIGSRFYFLKLFPSFFQFYQLFMRRNLNINQS